MLLFKENKEQLLHHLEHFVRTLEYRRQSDPDILVCEVAKSYIENEIAMEDGMRDYVDYLNQVTHKDRRLLKAIKSVKGKVFYKYLIEILSDTGKVDYAPFEIVADPVGEYQSSSEYGRTIKGYWVDQTTNGGMSGDNFAGTICIQLKENKYLKFQYEC